MSELKLRPPKEQEMKSGPPRKAGPTGEENPRTDLKVGHYKPRGKAEE